MSDDGGMSDERLTPPPPPPPRTPLAPPPPPPQAPDEPLVEEPPLVDDPPVAEELVDEPPAPQPPPAPGPAVAPGPVAPLTPPAPPEPPEPRPEAPAKAEAPEEPEKVFTMKRRNPLWRALVWLVVLALIAAGVYWWLHRDNDNDDGPMRHEIRTPAHVLGADRVMSKADRASLKKFNRTLYKQRKDASAVSAAYTGGKVGSFTLTGINGDPGGYLDYKSATVDGVLQRFFADVSGEHLTKVPAGAKGVRMQCGTLTRSGTSSSACVWVARQRAALVTFAQGDSASATAAKARKIRSAVEHTVPLYE